MRKGGQSTELLESLKAQVTFLALLQPFRAHHSTAAVLRTSNVT